MDQLLAHHKIDLSEKESTVKIEKIDVLGPGSSQGYIKDYIQIRPDLYLCLTSKRSIQLLYIIERDGIHRVQWSLPVQGLDWTIFRQEADQIKVATREKGSLENQQKEIREELFIQQIIEKKGLEARDRAIKSFLYPDYKKAWQDQIRQMDFSKPSSGQESLAGDLEKGQETDEARDSLTLDPEEIEKILADMLENREDREGGQVAKGRKLSLSPYGVGQKDQEIFDYYARLMNQEKEAMKLFWQKILGQIQKAENVDSYRERKGKLDVDSLILSYPDYLEAERKGTYKDLNIFKRQRLEPSTRDLPEKIEISFLVDNSGSMDPAKLDAAKKALSVTLLSIEDFQNYLNHQVASRSIPLKVQTESWFFGTGYQKIKAFDDREEQGQNKANIIKTITRLDGQGGSTDDASCLEEIDKSIDLKKERDIKEGRLIKMIFEITDGAPNLPGSSKKMIDKLKANGVDLYAFQIGKNNERSQKTFQFVWNEGYQEKMGLAIGPNIENLAPELLKILLKNMEKAIKKS